MEYTKGDWKVSKRANPDTSCAFIHIEGKPIIIADVYGDLANAQLIASAPDLYEALRELAVYVECKEVAKGKYLDNAFKALAKAEGK